MALENEKIVAANLYTVAGASTSTLFLTLAGQTALGASTVTPNPLSGYRLWDSVAMIWGTSGSLNGAFEVDVLGTVAGVTAIPLARRITINVNSGTTTVPTTTNTACMPLPTHFNHIVTSAGTGQTGTLSVIAKGRRENTPFSSGSAKVVEGVIDTTTVSFPDGVTKDVIRVLASNNAAAQTQVFQGLNKFTMWDSACYYINMTGLSGVVTVHLLGTINGRSVTIASTPSLSGAVASGVTKAAFVSNYFSASPTPKSVLYNFTTTGALAGITCQILAIAKSGRGRRGKI